MGRSQDEAAALVPDINVMLRDVQLHKANGIQLRCELVVPNLLFSMYNTHHMLSKEECQEVKHTPLDAESSPCGC